MHNSRKRKIGVVGMPSENKINEGIKKHIDDKVKQSLMDEYQVFNDPVHGHFELPKLLFKFIDTPQFQRLRHIKQLGPVYLVFPGASHNRFEHSLGVAFIAGRMARCLQKRQPTLGITQIDIFCVMIAGLCHDLGHGPLSHFFDGSFMPLVRPDYKWKHEQGSVDMFDHLITTNNLMPTLTTCGFSDRDIDFIKELILGPPKNESDCWPYDGRPEEKSYLYEIVANKRTGIDVDKWDYLARDCHHLGISNNFDCKRYMKFARVVSVNGKLQICTRDKEVSTLYDMFNTRNSLHRRAYHHKTAAILDCMISDAFIKANDYIFITGKDGKKLKMSECVEDMVAFTKLNDCIVNAIELQDHEGLVESKEILHRISTRKLYRFIGQSIIQSEDAKESSTELCKSILTHMDTENKHEDHFAVQVIGFDYGMKDKNPIDQVRFYDKNNPDVAKRLKKNQVSQMLPEKFAEHHLRFYYKREDQNIIADAERAFKKWCDSHSCSTIDVDNPELTYSSLSLSS